MPRIVAFYGMGYSGLIYAAIVAAWAAFLVPRWVRRNEEVDRAREADAARGVRVLSRRTGPPQAPHGRVVEQSVLEGPVAGAPAVQAAAAAAASEASVNSVDQVFAAAARRRRRLMVVLLASCVLAVGLAVAGPAPGWLPVVPGLLTLLFVFSARRAVVAQAQRRRALERRRAAVRRRAAAEQARLDAELAAAEAAEIAAAGRRLVLPSDEEPVADATDDSWSPVPVPLPTYLTKPKAPRAAARKIDLSSSGAWTSGRLDPASSIELPRREPAERPAEAPADRPAAATGTDGAVADGGSDEQTAHEHQHRRAVGD